MDPNRPVVARGAVRFYALVELSVSAASLPFSGAE
jgi:hypothetical protein